MDKTEFPPSLFLISTFFKQPSFDLNSYHLNIPEYNITLYISHGSCLINQNEDTDEPPKYAKTYTYPVDSNIPARLKNYSESLIKLVEEINDCVIEHIALSWGLDDESDEDEIPYLLSVENGSFTPKNELQQNYCFDYLLFLCYEIAKPTTPSECFIDTRNCVGGYLTIERRKIEAHFIGNYVNKLGLENPQEMYDYMMKRINFLCPQMMISPTPICPRCFPKYSAAFTFPKNKSSTKKEAQRQIQWQLQPENDEMGHTRKRSLPSRPQTRNSVRFTKDTSKTRLLSSQSQTRQRPSTAQSNYRYTATSNQNLIRTSKNRSTIPPTVIQFKDHIDLAELERRSQQPWKSINGTLRPTQNVSMKTYKQAYHLYHNQMGFPPILKKNRF